MTHLTKHQLEHLNACIRARHSLRVESWIERSPGKYKSDFRHGTITCDSCLSLTVCRGTTVQKCAAATP